MMIICSSHLIGTFNKHEIHAALAEIVAAHVDHELHVRVAVARRLTPGANRVHRGSEINKQRPITLGQSTDQCNLYLCVWINNKLKFKCMDGRGDKRKSQNKQLYFSTSLCILKLFMQLHK